VAYPRTVFSGFDKTCPGFGKNLGLDLDTAAITQRMDNTVQLIVHSHR